MFKQRLIELPHLDLYRKVLINVLKSSECHVYFQETKLLIFEDKNSKC